MTERTIVLDSVSDPLTFEPTEPPPRIAIKFRKCTQSYDLERVPNPDWPRPGSFERKRDALDAAHRIYTEESRPAVVSFTERVLEWKNSPAAAHEFEEYNEQFAEQEFDCIRCGGEGWTEGDEDDDDGDFDGLCGDCRGTGVVPIEGRLNREEWMDEQMLRHARGERTLP